MWTSQKKIKIILDKNWNAGRNRYENNLKVQATMMPKQIQCQQQKSNSKGEETKKATAAFITKNNMAKERLFLNISSMSNSSQSSLIIISRGIEKEKYN